MKFKLNTLVAAVVLSATAMSANAAIDSGLSGSNSEFIFSAWDVDAGIGYTYDLNWDKYLNDLVGIDQTISATGNTTLLANANVKSSLIDTNGIIFDQALTGFSSANFSSPTNVQWNLAAFDVAGRTRLLITEGDSGVPLASSTNQVRTAAAIISAYAPASNDFIVTPADDTFAVTASTNGNAYAGNAGSGYDGNLADTTNLLGGSANLFLLAQHTNLTSQGSFLSLNKQLLAFDGREIVAKTYLQDGEWRLQIAAVPEPETYAMLLAGLGFVGAIARRRNKQA